MSPRWGATADDDVQVLLPSPKNDRRIYAGGQFKRISGHWRLHLAALDPRTGTQEGLAAQPLLPRLRPGGDD